jgi:hypothetical protein
VRFESGEGIRARGDEFVADEAMNAPAGNERRCDLHKVRRRQRLETTRVFAAKDTQRGRVSDRHLGDAGFDLRDGSRDVHRA